MLTREVALRAGESMEASTFSERVIVRVHRVVRLSFDIPFQLNHSTLQTNIYASAYPISNPQQKKPSYSCTLLYHYSRRLQAHLQSSEVFVRTSYAYCPLPISTSRTYRRPYINHRILLGTYYSIILDAGQRAR